MRKIVLIWRESVYKNHFNCNQCGRKLADGDYPDSIYGLQGEYKERENNAGRNDI